MKRQNKSLLAFVFSAFALTHGFCRASDASMKEKEKEKEKDFSDFPAIVSAQGSIAPPLKFQSSAAKKYRTVISAGAEGAVNFSGNYRIVTWGCGTDCHGFAIVNLFSGSIHVPPGIRVVSGVSGNDDPRIEFRPDSRMLVISGYLNDVPSIEAKRIYVWDGKTLSLVEKTPLKKERF